MTEHPTSHEGRQPLAARPQERTRPRRETPPSPAAPPGTAPAPAPGPCAGAAAAPSSAPHPGAPSTAPSGTAAAPAGPGGTARDASARPAGSTTSTPGTTGGTTDTTGGSTAGTAGTPGRPGGHPAGAAGQATGASAHTTGAGSGGHGSGGGSGPGGGRGSGRGGGGGTGSGHGPGHGGGPEGSPPGSGAAPGPGVGVPTGVATPLGGLPAQAGAAAGPGHEPVMAARREGDRLRFVGAATRRIARGIDLDEIVLGLCRATVPTFSDAILVYLRDPLPVGDERPVDPFVLRLRRTDRLRLTEDDSELGLSAADPDTGLDLGPAAELCEVQAGGALAEVLRGVRPVFGDSAAARAALPELLGDGRCVPSGHRAILAPLRGRRRVIGAAVFLRRPDRPPFEPNDLLVAAQLATHTALGIDKAVLYGREAYIADELQRTMLPENLPQPTGVKLASRYLPAAETARVGGDWYDAIPLPGSRVALVVGDVMGHSMTSAAIMGQLRTTAQTLAGLDLPPQEVLHHLDEQAQRLGENRMATCLYAVYDPVAHRITIANAGHPPPILLHLGGRAEVLRVPPGAPIGVGGVDFEAVELDAPAGATLLLYTDGLVESRLRDVWTGIEQLRERLAATAQLTGPDHSPPLEALCDDVLDMLGPGDRDDDIALLAARFDGIAPSDVAYWFLEPEEQAPGRARRLARRALARWDLEELSDSVELLVSEVVTNAVRYAERPVTLRLLRTDVLRCEVGDDAPQLPRQRRARDTDEGGRGLFLVNRLARRWGATRLSTGKVVWFELPTRI
ncbi:SpoIIE family protein phosphatase [Streptomyces ficellus]|uniref:protein-serine/threonine phosphatase n=1 Tax=Streptomyces ficellus TaxID=1977088 RepID=A0A6I6FFI9_9ACTN|nr:SpoIIE family protein phosphatase [Streptomyces ficellus]QGV78792.1 serine/threonine protein phosphatase [Streptomyces ficellus]